MILIYTKCCIFNSCKSSYRIKSKYELRSYYMSIKSFGCNFISHCKNLSISLNAIFSNRKLYITFWTIRSFLTVIACFRNVHVPIVNIAIILPYIDIFRPKRSIYTTKFIQINDINCIASDHKRGVSIHQYCVPDLYFW